MNSPEASNRKAILFANTDWYLYNFRLSLARELRKTGYEVLLLSPAGEYTDHFIQSGFRWQPIAVSRRGINPFQELRTAWQLWKTLRVEKPFLLHSFTLKCNLHAAIAGKIVGARKIVHSITGLGYFFYTQQQSTLLRRLLEFSMRVLFRCEQVIFQNSYHLELFRKRGIVREQHSFLIPSSGVDIDYFKPSPEESEEVLVIFPARYLRDKGVVEFIEAARLLKKSNVAARFALVGATDPGNPSSVSANELAEWNREGIVEDWGWQTDMRKVYQLAHIVCLPSYHEGLPKVLIEAAASGRAIVTTDIPGCRDVVSQGENGYLVPVGDTLALSEALHELIQDPELRAKMGRRGRKRAEQRFSAALVNQQTLEVYGRV